MSVFTQVFVIVMLVFPLYFWLLECLSSLNTEIGRWLIVHELVAVGGHTPAAVRIPCLTLCFLIALCSPHTGSLSPPFMSLLPLSSQKQSLSE